jgi:co-chaperonin GroES (HSP10)
MIHAYVDLKDRRRVNAEGESTGVEEKKIQFEIEPLQKWVLIRKIEREEKIVDGVVIPGGGKSSRGIVVARAEGVALDKGDLVIFTNFPIELEDLEEITGDKALKLVRYEEVYARVKQCT